MNELRKQAKLAVRKKSRTWVKWFILGAVIWEFVYYTHAITIAESGDAYLGENINFDEVVTIISEVPDETMVQVIPFQKAYWSLPQSITEEIKRVRARQLLIDYSFKDLEFRKTLLKQIQQVIDPQTHLGIVFKTARVKYIQKITDLHIGRLMCLLIFWPILYWASGVYLWGGEEKIKAEMQRLDPNKLPDIDTTLLD